MKKNILMLAAEHGRFKGAKVGGVGDVIRDLPQALIQQGCTVNVAIPSYGFLNRESGVRSLSFIDVEFGRQMLNVEILIYRTAETEEDVYIFHHPLFSPQGETVYCDDSNHQPFATDATKFAFFCACVATALCHQVIELPHTVHCHDWHMGFFPMLVRRHQRYANIANIHIVFTIHNMAMQGVRPIRNDPSSLLNWFSEGISDYEGFEDPDYAGCINPMRAGITLSDLVHTVSPTYAQEVLQPSDHASGIYGGERLEADLMQRHEKGELFGILNGCDYSEKKLRKPAKARLINTALLAQEEWVSRHEFVKSAHFLAQKRMHHWLNCKTAPFTVTSVGRITEQKVRLLFTELANGKLALDVMLEKLNGKGFFILLGSGAADLEQKLTRLMGKHNHFVFLNGYNEPLSKQLYAYGDLFLMPSSFEPCGISQLLAMRAGQPCLVNEVGGLKDTVKDNQTGFVFNGNDDATQAKKLVSRFNEALSLYYDQKDAYKKIADNAKSERFSWESIAQNYIAKLYTQ